MATDKGRGVDSQEKRPARTCDRYNGHIRYPPGQWAVTRVAGSREFAAKFTRNRLLDLSAKGERGERKVARQARELILHR